MTLRNSLRLAVLISTVACVSCRSPMADAQMAEQMRQMGDEINASRQDLATINERLDSLRTVAIKQDSVIRQLANLAGVQIVR